MPSVLPSGSSPSGRGRPSSLRDTINAAVPRAEQNRRRSPRSAILATAIRTSRRRALVTAPPSENLLEVAIGVEERDRPAVRRPERAQSALCSSENGQCGGSHVSQDQLRATVHRGFEHEPLTIRRDRPAVVIFLPHVGRQGQVETHAAAPRD